MNTTLRSSNSDLDRTIEQQKATIRQLGDEISSLTAEIARFKADNAWLRQQKDECLADMDRMSDMLAEVLRERAEIMAENKRARAGGY